MISLNIDFTRAAFKPTAVSDFTLLLLALFIINDSQKAEKEKRKKREWQAKLQRNPLAGPKPF
jgi:hypothetical protein